MRQDPKTSGKALFDKVMQGESLFSALITWVGDDIHEIVPSQAQVTENVMAIYQQDQERMQKTLKALGEHFRDRELSLETNTSTRTGEGDSATGSSARWMSRLSNQVPPDSADSASVGKRTC